MMFTKRNTSLYSINHNFINIKVKHSASHEFNTATRYSWRLLQTPVLNFESVILYILHTENMLSWETDDAFAVNYMQARFAKAIYLLFFQYKRGSASSSSAGFSFDNRYCILPTPSLHLNVFIVVHYKNMFWL